MLLALQHIYDARYIPCRRNPIMFREASNIPKLEATCKATITGKSPVANYAKPRTITYTVVAGSSRAQHALAVS